MRIGAMVLAAGAATRMGSVKQLLPYLGRTLVEHAIQQASEAGFAPVVVVLGAQAEAVKEAVSRTDAQWVVNQDWETGMGSSLRCGMSRITGVDAVAILLADQPLVLAKQLAGMIQAFERSSAPILAAHYAGTVGVPAIFRSSVFAALRDLPPDSGARALLRGSDVARFELPEAAIDVDTPEEFAVIRDGPQP